MTIRPQIRNLFVTTLLFIYGLGFGFLQAGPAYPASGIHADATDGYSFTEQVVQAGLHIPQAEVQVASGTHLPVRLLKDGNHTAGAVPCFESVIEHGFKFRQHLGHSLLLSLRKAELLYPAHFFW